jgi:hypothetical protein
MWSWFKAIDRLLRGELTRLPVLSAGKFEIPLFGFTVVIILLGGIYGVCMGVFALTPGGSGHPMQMLAAAIKTPALFLLTLLVTFPSLYVFNALVGSRLLLPSVLRLLIASLAVMLAILASMGTVVAFFSFTTTSYPFMLLLNVVVFAVAGVLGLSFLLQTLHRLTAAQTLADSQVVTPTDPSATATSAEGAGPLQATPTQLPSPQVKVVFRIWIIVFGLVGAQMAWVLRPFIGNPSLPFTWFRPPSSNFFEAVVHAAQRLFMPG